MVAKFVGIVKRQIEYWNHIIANYGPGHRDYRPAQITKLEHLSREFGELLEYLEGQEEGKTLGLGDQLEAALRARAKPPKVVIPQTPQPSPTPQSTRDDLSDLPPELLKELSDSAKGETDILIKVIDGRGGTATLDEILIDLYRKHKEIGKRPLVANKLYRLSRRGLCWSVPGQKGAYTTTEPEGIDISNKNENPENDEGPDAATSEPSSNEQGVAGSPEGPSNPSPVGSTPTASTKRRRDLFASAAIPSVRAPR